MSTESVAKRLVELCRSGEFEAAQKELYAQDAESIEAEGSPQGDMGNVKGLEAIYKKGEAFQASVQEMHGVKISDATVAGNWFSLAMTLDVTMKEHGRIEMTEICVYHVKDGKIDREQFFYDMG